LQNQHFERLFGGLLLLKFEIPELLSKERLLQEVLELCGRNDCENLARVRLSVFRGNGGLYEGDSQPGYVIECWPLDESVNRLNENGLVIDIYPDSRKSCDQFSNLKSASFQPYLLAALYAKENKLNDCLVLNTSGNIADSTIANIFLVKNNVIVTPALSEGCISGVMRKYLLGKLMEAGYPVIETSVSTDDLNKADEIFLTNAIKGVRWVRQFRKREYVNSTTEKIYNDFVRTIHI
jgi:branched-chain amino acid aminotransferase